MPTPPMPEPDTLAEVPGAASALSVQETSVALSNKVIQAERNQSRNTVDLCIRILSNNRNCRLFEAVNYIVEPFRRTFCIWETRVKSPRGTLDLHLELAAARSTATLLGEAWSRIFAGADGFSQLRFIDPVIVHKP